MNILIEKIRNLLNEELLAINDTEKPLDKLTLASKALEEAINNLNILVVREGFADEDEEIMYFKIFRPEIIALRIEGVMRYNLIVKKPIGPHDTQLKYYEDELEALQSFFRMNSFQYQYYRNGLGDLDTIYFLRRTQPLQIPLADVSENDPALSTQASALFAKFIAYEHVQYFIVEQMGLLKYPELFLINKNAVTSAELKWTGESINIVELAYGIWLTGQLNNGNASLNQIVRWLEANLQVNIGVVQRRFIEIERRKRLSPTKYIDQMRDAIKQKIESDND